jgi:hypothetical protein
MPRLDYATRVILGLLLLICTAVAGGQSSAIRAPVLLTVVDENGLEVVGAEAAILEPGHTETRLWTDFASH